MLRSAAIIILLVLSILVGLIVWKHHKLSSSSVPTGQTSTNSPSQVAGMNGFPGISLIYINPTDINPNAKSYQMADYDAKRNQVIFYPYGELSPVVNNGILLTYKVDQDFTNLSSWQTADLSQIINKTAVNFGGGFLDDADNYAYLPAGQKTDRALSNTATTVRVNLAKEAVNPNDPSAYESIDLRNLPGIPATGGFAGVFGNGYAYFAPTVDTKTGDFHGIFTRYNSAKNYSDPSAWEWYNLNNITNPPDHDLGGMQSLSYKAPYVYLIPFLNGTVASKGQTKLATKLIRFDTTASGGFTSASSYQVFDLAKLPFPSSILGKLKGLTGGVVVGNQVVFVPWGSRDLEQTSSVALIFDTTKNLNDTSAWQYIDLTTINSKAGGYQFGWLDKNGFVWFVPTHNYNIKPANPPFVVWNSKLPFNDPKSWTSYPSPERIWSTGAAYDPTTNTAWLSPYGAVAVLSGNITQVQEK